MRNRDRQAKILIVDDEKINIDVLVGLLKPRYRITAAKNGKHALGRLAQTSPPDLILLDIMMPGMDGYEVCRRLRENKKTADIPVIFISALDEPIDKVKAFETGGVDYVTKPFFAEEVLARVNAHLRLRAAQRLLEEQNISLREANYELRSRQNTIIRLLGDVSKIKLSGDVHAIRNLAQHVFEHEKTETLKNMADQVAGIYRTIGDKACKEFIAGACRQFGIDRDILSDPEKIAGQLRNIDFGTAQTVPGSDSGGAPGDDIDPMLSDLFSEVVLLDDAYERFVEMKNAGNASVARYFNPFAQFFSLRRLRDFIGQINRHFGQYKSMEFVQPIRLSRAIESACDQALADKGKIIRIENELGHDPELRTNADAISGVFRDLVYNAIDADAAILRVVAERPSKNNGLPFAGRWRFEDFPSLYIRFEDDGSGLDKSLAVRINDYLDGRLDDESALSTKGKDKGGLGTKTLRDFLFLHKGRCCYQSAGTGVRVHIYLEKLEI